MKKYITILIFSFFATLLRAEENMYVNINTSILSFFSGEDDFSYAGFNSSVIYNPQSIVGVGYKIHEIIWLNAEASFINNHRYSDINSDRVHFEQVGIGFRFDAGKNNTGTFYMLPQALLLISMTDSNSKEVTSLGLGARLTAGTEVSVAKYVQIGGRLFAEYIKTSREDIIIKSMTNSYKANEEIEFIQIGLSLSITGYF